MVNKRRRATRSWTVSRRDVFEIILSVSGESGGAGWRKSRESKLLKAEGARSGKVGRGWEKKKIDRFEKISMGVFGFRRWLTFGG